MNFIIIFQTIHNRYIFVRHINSSCNSFFSFTKKVVNIKTLHDLNPLVWKKYIYVFESTGVIWIIVVYVNLDIFKI